MEDKAEDSKPVRKMVEYYIDSTSDEESSEEDDGTEATLTAWAYKLHVVHGYSLLATKKRCFRGA